LQRTRLLLHLVDILPPDPDQDIVQDVQRIAGELEKFSPELAAQERWLVINKLDQLSEEDADQACEKLLEGLGWEGKVFRISGLSGEGVKELAQACMNRLEEMTEEAAAEAMNAEALNPE
jgi:GTP-binding protein